MPRNGSGIYSAPTNSFNPATTGQDALPADWNATLADVSDALSDSIDAGGTTTVTANLPMNDKVLTGLGAGTAASHSVNLGQAQDGAISYAVASGTDTYTATLSPAPASYVTGATYKILIGNANATTSPTLNLNSLGAKDIVSLDGSAPDVGMIKAALYFFTYDGTSFRVSAVDYGGVAFLDAANVFTANQSIVSTDSGAGQGPEMKLYRRSSSPTGGDALGALLLYGRNSSAADIPYGQVVAQISDATAGTEDGAVLIQVIVAGSLQTRISANPSGTALVGDASVSGTLIALGDATVGGALDVTGALTAANFGSGTYTPTLTNGANVAASTPAVNIYMRSGSMVTVYGSMQVDPTNNTTLTQVDISLPIASNLGANSDCQGQGASVSPVETAVIGSNTTDNRAVLQFVSATTSSHTIIYSFMYRII